MGGAGQGWADLCFDPACFPPTPHLRTPTTHRVAGPPVEQVEVVVVDEVGGVEDAVGLLRHGAERLLGPRPRVCGVERGHGVLVALGGRGRLLLEGEDAGRLVLAQVGR